MAKKIKPIPRNLQTALDQVQQPYLQAVGKNTPLNTKEINRGNEISYIGDKDKKISIGLEDIDNAILYHIDNNIKPVVNHNNSLLKVPVIYGSQERWKSVQNDGFYRDKNGKLMSPLLMVTRTSVTPNKSLGNKLDGNKANLFQVFKTRYNSKNQYDNFGIINNMIPSDKYHVTVVPDYITINYDCILLTDFVEQNNKVLEAIEFASDSYWGDLQRHKFRTMIENFSTPTTQDLNSERSSIATFSLNVNGYIIPDSINKKLAELESHYSKSNITLNFNIS
jgi:hypothetical protein